MHVLKTFSVIAALSLVACGGDGGSPEPAISSTVVGSYEGRSFTGDNGFATTVDGSPLIAIGDGPLRCGTEDDQSPPTGRNAVIVPPSFEVGSYTGVFVNLYENVGTFAGTGGNLGILEITKADEVSVAGVIEFTLEDQDGSYSLGGSFEVIRCP